MRCARIGKKARAEPGAARREIRASVALDTPVVTPPRTPLRETFLAHAGPAAPVLAAGAELEEVLRRQLDTARAAWPQLTLSSEDFVRALAESVAGEREPARALAELCAADLLLVRACARAEAAALVSFDARLKSEVRIALRTYPDPVAEEVLGILRERLLVAPPGEQPRIVSYSGRGSLSSWVRVAAVRAALNLQARQREVFVEEASSSASPLPTEPGPHPELAFLKHHYRDDFNAALEAAITSLEPGLSVLLRQHFLEGQSIDALGRRHGVHRSTAARWVVRGREALMAELRAQLVRRLSVSDPELDSLLGLMRSQLDASLGRLLKNAEE